MFQRAHIPKTIQGPFKYCKTVGHFKDSSEFKLEHDKQLTEKKAVFTYVAPKAIYAAPSALCFTDIHLGRNPNRSTRAFACSHTAAGSL